MGGWFDRHLHNNERSENSLIGWKSWANYPGEVTAENPATDGVSTPTFDLNRVQKELIPNRVQNVYIKIPKLTLWYRTKQEAEGGLTALLNAWNTKELLQLNDATGAHDNSTAASGAGGAAANASDAASANVSDPIHINTTSYLQYKLFTLIQAQLNTEEIHSFDGTRGVKPLTNSSFAVTKEVWPVVCKTFKTEGKLPIR